MSKSGNAHLGECFCVVIIVFFALYSVADRQWLLPDTAGRHSDGDGYFLLSAFPTTRPAV